MMLLMAMPTVFVSSTFYDLRYARESIKRFIEQLGYTAVLSEDGTVFYDPKVTAAEGCLKEVSNAHILVLLIGGRYGMELPGTGLSVTNAEYQQAVASKIPIFALVDNGTYNDYLLYRANVDLPDVLGKITFPNADSVKIFEFIDAVRTRTENNALVPFRTIADIETYLRSQWAGMMHDYVTTGAKEAQVVDTLEMLKRVNARVELIASQILRSVGTPIDRLYVNLMLAYTSSSLASDLRHFGRATPLDVMHAETVEACASRLGKEIRDYHDPQENKESYIISSSGEVTRPRLRQMRKEYRALRNVLLKLQQDAGVSLTDLEKYESEIGRGDLEAEPSLLEQFEELDDAGDDEGELDQAGGDEDEFDDLLDSEPSLAEIADAVRRGREADSRLT